MDVQHLFSSRSALQPCPVRPAIASRCPPPLVVVVVPCECPHAYFGNKNMLVVDVHVACLAFADGWLQQRWQRRNTRALVEGFLELWDRACRLFRAKDECFAGSYFMHFWAGLVFFVSSYVGVVVHRKLTVGSCHMRDIRIIQNHVVPKQTLIHRSLYQPPHLAVTTANAGRNCLCLNTSKSLPQFEELFSGTKLSSKLGTLDPPFDFYLHL